MQASLSEDLGSDFAKWPVLICLLGSFRLLCRGVPLPVRSGGRTETLLSSLALRHGSAVPREVLLADVWPDAETSLAGQALNSLLHNLNRNLSTALEGRPAVSHQQGSYQLNALVGVDSVWFDGLATAGERQERAGFPDAIDRYESALTLYKGDLRAGNDQRSLIERERLRAVYLTLLARAAGYYYSRGDNDRCLELGLRLLAHDACREDAHRLVMSCYVRRGERAQALRQYQLCTQLLRTEFDADPEPATTALYQQIRLNPASISGI